MAEAKKKCGAKLSKKDGDERDYDTCQQPAGYRTGHPGYGRCVWHTGGTPAGKMAAWKEETMEVIKTLRANSPIMIEPDALLLQEVHRSAGVIAYLETLIGDIEAEDLFHLTEEGTKPRAFIEVYRKEREHGAKVAKMALDAGVAERAVRLAEEQGRLIAEAIRSILGDLGLSPEQAELAPQIVRRHLMALPAGDPPVDVEVLDT